MGWLDKDEQLKVRKKFGVMAIYMCDYCHTPIRQGEMPVVDPKGGYHSWRGIPRSCRSFLSREPKKTYHVNECNDLRRGRKPKEYNQGDDMSKHKEKKSKKDKTEKKSKKSKVKEVSSEVKTAAKLILKLVTKKPAHYGKKDFFRKLADNYEKKDIRKAIKVLYGRTGGERQIGQRGGKYSLVG